MMPLLPPQGKSRPIIDVAARLQKWVDPPESVNHFFVTPEMRAVSGRSNLDRTSRHAWDIGLKTTYYLRTLQASKFENPTIDVKKETRGVMGSK